MKKLIFTLVFLFATGMFLQTEAQSVNSFLRKKANQATNRAGRKADERVTKEMNKAVDKGVENVFNKILEGEEDSTSTSGQTNANNSSSSGSSSAGSDAMSRALMKKMGVSMERPENIQDSYNYTGNIVMQVQTWDGDGNSEGETQYTTFMAEDNSGFAMEFYQEEEGKTTMIYDYEGEAFLILTDDGSEKTGMVTQFEGLNDSIDFDDEDFEDDETVDYSVYNENLKKTGRSKKIAGYKCDEYIYDDEESHAEVWITGELPADLWAKMYGTNVLSATAAGVYGGFVMETDQKDKETGERSYMQVQEVNRHQDRSISTTGYTFMSIKVNVPEEEAEAADSDSEKAE